MPLTRRMLSPLVELREGEAATALLMFLYSFLAMTAYNIIQPLTRSKVISSLGAVNVPWVIFGSGLVIGGLMLLYTRTVTVLPRRWALPITQAGMAALMVAFWLLFRTGSDWVSVAFYIWGALLGILLISQFWTLANGIYDPRQAKRLFGFIGGGVTLGGMTGAGLTALIVDRVGANTLLLWSTFALLLCMVIVAIIMGRHEDAAPAAAIEEEKGVSISRAMSMLRGSRQIQLIAVVISFGSLGALLIDQQLNMAAEVFKGAGQEDAIGAFLAQVRFYLSAAAFVIQVWITPRIHRYLGIGFALLILPTNLGATAALILLNKALWAPAVASVMDRSFRYTVDKTTREVLFLPLPAELRQDIKPFVDVTVDRLSRGLGALLMLVLIQPWGLGLAWYQLSIVSLALAAIWYVVAFMAKREYMTSFRRSIARQEIDTRAQPLATADLTTIEALLEEMAHPDEGRVLYAIDVLESLDKRNLITPLLLRHESPAVRVRALGAMTASRPELARRWEPTINGLLSDTNPEVRAAAVRALAAVRGDAAAEVARPMLTDPDSRLVVTAATILADSPVPQEARDAHAALAAVCDDRRPEAAGARRDVAAALKHVRNADCRRLLIPLLYDSDASVCEEAMRSVSSLPYDPLFVPTLIALLRNRRLKAAARDVLVGYGPEVLPLLEHFLRDPDEDPWVRRHLPATIARIGTPRAVEILVGCLSDPDGFTRFKAIESLERLRRADGSLQCPREPVERLIAHETRRYFAALTAHDSLFIRQSSGSPATKRDALLAQALTGKAARARDRVFKLLALLYPGGDIDAARWALEHGEARARASAVEYLDNVLASPMRRLVLPVIEPLPREELLRRAYVQLRSRPRSTEETLLELINDEDQVIAAAAIHLVGEIGEWRLKDDIEHVLAHRDVHDWYVFEAASWTLAAERVGQARTREAWREPLPATELAERLRQLPLFAGVAVDELFRLANAGRQVRHDPGRLLLQEDVPVDAVHVLLDGSVRCGRQDSPEVIVSAPAAIGLRETIEGRPAESTVRAEAGLVTLMIPADDVKTLLADNQDLIDGLLKTFAGELPVDDSASTPVRTGHSDLLSLAADGTVPIHKALVLQRLPLFARVASQELMHAAAIARLQRVDAGKTLAAKGHAPAVHFVLRGELTSEAPGITVGPGDAVGMYETLAGQPIGYAVGAAQPSVVLIIDRVDLLDLLGHRPGLAQQVFASLFQNLQPGRAMRT
jgi:ATP/ADP translocase/CRP-like cAMP-binding protein